MVTAYSDHIVLKATFLSLCQPALALVLLTSWLSPAQAAPRVGLHQGYTRLVFALPSATQARAQQRGSQYRVILGKSLHSESGGLSAAGVSSYRISGNVLTLQLTRQGKPRVQVLAHPARLVVDVPTTGKPLAAGRTKTAPQAQAVVRPAASHAQRTVVIDAGHGGIDPGMTSRWVTEKVVTLDIAQKVKARLQQRGIKVIMTRNRDTQLSLDKSTDLEARSRLAQNDKVNAYVSIHVNAGSPAAQGIETYYFGAPLSGSNRSLAVAENGGGDIGRKLTARASNKAQSMLGDLVAQAKLTFSRNLATQVQRNLVSVTGAYNRGVLSDAFYVIRNPTTAAILIEVGFGSSPTEGPKLALDSYRSRIANSIADSIANFLHQ